MISKEEYNREPVFYCTNCLSLAIKELRNIEDLYICEECGNADISSTDIDDWNKMYVAYYDILFLEEND